MKYSQLQKYLSEPRLTKFLSACGNSKVKAKILYRDNLRISQSFYPLLNLFEIVLRNRIDNILTTHFCDPNWVRSQKAGFMSDTSLSRTRYFLKYSVSKAEGKLRRSSITITPGKIIAELSFGFWTSLYESNHYRLVCGSIIRCFANKPAVVNRNAVMNKLKRIRKFRNRVYHNEPICFVGNSVDFSNADTVYNDIFDLIKWIDPDLVSYFEYFDNVKTKINQCAFS